MAPLPRPYKSTSAQKDYYNKVLKAWRLRLQRGTHVCTGATVTDNGERAVSTVYWFQKGSVADCNAYCLVDGAHDPLTASVADLGSRVNLQAQRSEVPVAESTTQYSSSGPSVAQEASQPAALSAYNVVTPRHPSLARPDIHSPQRISLIAQTNNQILPFFGHSPALP